MDLHELIDKVIEQIKRDFESEDTTALVELLMQLPKTRLTEYLTEGE